MAHALALALVLTGPVHAQSMPEPSESGPAARPLPEANVFMQGLAEKQRKHEEARSDYTYDIFQVQEQLDKRGTVKERKTRSYEVFYVQGRPVRRQVAEDGSSFTAQRLAKEDERVSKDASEIAKAKAKKKSDDPPLSAILARYDFHSVAREEIEGRPAIVMDFAPRPGKRDLDYDNVLRSLAGRIWIDEEEREVVRAEIRNTGAIKVALGIAASVSELDVTLLFRKVDEGLWLPLRVETQVAGRLLLFKGIRVRTSEAFSRYRRFQVDSEEQVRPVESTTPPTS